MSRLKKMHQEKSEGKITYSDVIIDNIVTLAVEELPYVELYHKANSKGKNPSVVIYYDKKGIDVDLTVKIHYTQRVSETVFRIQEAVRHTVETMTDSKIQSVNVIVLGVLLDEPKPEPKPEEKVEDKQEVQETVHSEEVKAQVNG